MRAASRTRRACPSACFLAVTADAGVRVAGAGAVVMARTSAANERPTSVRPSAGATALAASYFPRRRHSAQPLRRGHHHEVVIKRSPAHARQGRALRLRGVALFNADAIVVAPSKPVRVQTVSRAKLRPRVSERAAIRVARVFTRVTRRVASRVTRRLIVAHLPPRLFVRASLQRVVRRVSPVLVVVAVVVYVGVDSRELAIRVAV